MKRQREQHVKGVVVVGRTAAPTKMLKEGDVIEVKRGKGLIRLEK